MSAVAVVDAGGANLASVLFALERLDCRARMARDADELRGSSHVILPGVGAAAPAMALLRERGLDATLRAPEVPLLGICLGMQLLFDGSEEGGVAGIGLLPGRVARLEGGPAERIPHMGWNSLQPLRSSPLLKGIGAGSQFYFVHGYAAPVTADCVALSRHGAPFAAIVQRGCVAGVQFHPERSAAAGQRLLANFIGMEAA